VLSSAKRVIRRHFLLKSCDHSVGGLSTVELLVRQPLQLLGRENARADGCCSGAAGPKVVEGACDGKVLWTTADPKNESCWPL
jgi:hypothetical protein